MTVLPGLSVTLNDYGLRVEPPLRGTKVTVIGYVSNSGVPLLEPRSVSNINDAINTLRFYPSGAPESGIPGEMGLAIEQISDAGVTDIEVLALDYTYNLTGAVISDTKTGLLEMYRPQTGLSKHRYDDLSGAYDILINHPTDIVVPCGAHMDDRWQDFGKQLANFCYQATAEGNTAFGVIPTLTPMQWGYVYQTGAGEVNAASNISATVSGELVAAFGTSGTNSTSDIVQALLFDIPSTALVNGYVTDHGDPLLASSAKVTHSHGRGAYKNWLSGSLDPNGNYGTSAASSNQVSSSYWTDWQAKETDGTDATDDLGNKVDAGAFINVVTSVSEYSSPQTKELAGVCGASLSYTNYNSNAAAGYAGLVGSLKSHSGATNKQIDGFASLKAISATQGENLNTFRQVTLLNRATGYTVSKDVTGGHAVSDYVRTDYHLLTTRRIADEAVTRIKAISESYIGEANNAPQRQALELDIKTALQDMAKEGKIQDFNLVISSTPDQQVLGEADVSLTFVPAFELTKLNLIVSLAKS